MEKEKELLEKLKEQTKTLIEESNSKMINKEVFNERLEDIKSQLDKINGDEGLGVAIKNIEATVSKHDEVAKRQGELIEEMKNKSNSEKRGFKSIIKEFLDSDEYKEFSDRKGKGTISREFKDVTLGSDYTGGQILITRDSGVTVVPNNRSINMRDIIPVEPTDLPYIVFDKVYDEDYVFEMEGENDILAESAFKVKEVTEDVKRVGTYIPISKRMLKSVKWLNSYLTRVLPKKLYAREDFQILFGDGSGNNLDGLSKNATTFDLTGNAYIAGDIASVATWNSGTQSIVTFTADHELKNGDLITFALSTTGYNNEYIAKVRNKTQILIDQAYSAGSTAAWTATSKNPLYQSIDNAQQVDVLNATRALLKRGEFEVTGHVCNPMDTAKMEALKDTTAQYLGIVRGSDGILRISGIPVVETTAIPAGEFLSGDFQMAVSLLEFTNATVEMTDDVSYKLTNKIAVIIQEEIIMPIYNPLMFIYGNFATAAAQLETT